MLAGWHERFQSLWGIGTQLITALERKIIDHGRPMARMLVEHDNPEPGHFTSDWAIPRQGRHSPMPAGGRR